MTEKRYRGIRYSLTSLVGIVGLIGVGLGALTHSNPWWAIGLVYTTFLLLLLATVWGLYRRSVFAGGFAVGGFAWLVLVFAFSQSGLRDPDDLPAGMMTDSQGRVTAYTKGPYAIEENPLHPEQLCRRASSLFRDPASGLFMNEDEFRCFRIEANCFATWLVGLFTGVVVLLLHQKANP